MLLTVSFSEGAHTVLRVGALWLTGDPGRGCMSELWHIAHKRGSAALPGTRHLGPAGGRIRGWEETSTEHTPQAFSSSLLEPDTQQSMKLGVGRSAGSRDMPPGKPSQVHLRQNPVPESAGELPSSVLTSSLTWPRNLNSQLQFPHL